MKTLVLSLFAVAAATVKLIQGDVWEGLLLLAFVAVVYYLSK